VQGDDGQLVARTLQGEPAAYSELVGRYRDAVCGIAYHHLGDLDAAQDAAQEAFVRAYVRLRQLRDPGKFAPWLRQIATTVCLDLLRRKADEVLSPEVGRQQPRPAEDDLEQLTARMVVREALAKLSDKSRLTVALYYINGYSHGEIASFLDVSINTIRTRLHRAKKQLRQEMITMVSDVLQEGRPDEEFVGRVVREAISRGHEAREAHATGEALQHYDEALEALEKMPPGPERQKLKMDLLWSKGGASEFSPGFAEAVAIYEQALKIAGELGDRTAQANMMAHVGVTSSNAGDPEKARRCYEKAQELYHELGDPGGEGVCLFWQASLHLFAKEPAQARPYLEQAIPLLRAARSREWVATCRAALALLREVPEKKLPEMIEYSATCALLAETPSMAKFLREPGVGHSELADAPGMYSIGDVFWQVGHAEKLLDLSVEVGGSWSGDAFSYSLQPLKAVVTVKSKSEGVTVPVGSFSDCLLTEQVTTESDLPDKGEERQKELNRKYLCGRRRAWYAPGVGLVQLQVLRGDGVEALIQLNEFSVHGGENEYLPLARANRWVYTWVGAPARFVARDVYRVAGRSGQTRFLEHYSYVYPGPETKIKGSRRTNRRQLTNRLEGAGPGPLPGLK